ncbi:MAG: hypothetical protein CM15mP84_00220 [Cellvibrionales bacterium]|nr:MAG: hypothetical protein CM15mP84_00220 [Cellvibrionales bacterium]
MNDLTLDQVIEAFERSVELTPVLAELPWEERAPSMVCSRDH